MADPPGGPGKATHDATPPADRRLSLQGAFQEMEKQLRHHGALEDLGPLFAPEAQGRRPSPPLQPDSTAQSPPLG